jgi:hypothetical protein
MQTAHFQLRFDVAKIPHWASRYSYPSDSQVELTVGPRSKEAGCFTKADFLTVCHWKSPRIIRRCEDNSEEFIRAVTSVALSSPCEELRISSLTLLRGVQWPVASVCSISRIVTDIQFSTTVRFGR